MNKENEETIEHEKGQTENTPETIDMEQDDDVQFEDVNDEGDESSLQDKIKKLRLLIKKIEKEKQDNMNGWQRAQADYVNFKKEVEVRRKDDIKFANKKLFMELLPVLDSYDMAKANATAWNSVDANWRTGIEYIFNQFVSVLNNEGVEQFGNVGDTFDPNLHESIEHVEVKDAKDNDTLVQVLQKGYKIGETVLRPARVKTGEYKTN